MNIVKELSAKVAELERKLKATSTSPVLDVFQNKSVMGEFVETTILHSLGEISAESSGQSVLQVLVQIRAEVTNSVNIKLRAGGMLLYDCDRALSIGDNEIFLMATVMMAGGESLEVELEVTPKSELSNYLSSATLYLWSSCGSANSSDKSLLNADLSGELLCVSLMIDKKIYNLMASSTTNLDFSDFSYYADGIESDCVLIDSEGPSCIWFRLASDNTLYMSRTGNVQDEEVVATAVSSFSASAYGGRTGVLVCYISNDLPFYKTIEGYKISSEVAFEVNRAKKYKNICTLKSDSAYVYVVISTESGANLLYDILPELYVGSKSGDCIVLSSEMYYA